MRLCNVGSLKSLDIEIMKRLGSRVNLIPVIAKADTLTPHDLQKFKENVSVFSVVNQHLGSYNNQSSGP